MVVSAWLPASHGGYLAPFAASTVKLGTLYEPYCLWGVPDYATAETVASVADLVRPEVAARMPRRSQGINPEELSMIGVKAAVGHRVAYGPIASAEFTVSTSGPCTSDLTRLPYTRLRRPVFPLDRLDA